MTYSANQPLYQMHEARIKIQQKEYCHPTSQYDLDPIKRTNYVLHVTIFKGFLLVTYMYTVALYLFKIRLGCEYLLKRIIN